MIYTMRLRRTNILRTIKFPRTEKAIVNVRSPDRESYLSPDRGNNYRQRNRNQNNYRQGDRENGYRQGVQKRMYEKKGCGFFNTRRGCINGVKCRFLHVTKI